MSVGILVGLVGTFASAITAATVSWWWPTYPDGPEMSVVYLGPLNVAAGLGTGLLVWAGLFAVPLLLVFLIGRAAGFRARTTKRQDGDGDSDLGLDLFTWSDPDNPKDQSL